MKIPNNLKIVIAGPGSGKTHNLKDEVIRCLPELELNRFCAVITYTNAATEELRKRISQQVRIQPNLFIGTIHSFLIRFIIEPYSHLLSLTPVEKIYIDSIDINDLKKKNIIQKKLSDEGKISFDKVLQLSNLILSNKFILSVFINRFKYIFVDEYQDSHPNIHKVFELIRKSDKVSLYIIGDPLQNIYNFSNSRSKSKKNKSKENLFLKIPLIEIKNNNKLFVEQKIKNYRSTKEIVDLINYYNFDNDSKQESSKGISNIPTVFIDEVVADDIYNRFIEILSKFNVETIHENSLSDKDVIKEIYLTSEWKLLEDMYRVQSIAKLEKGNSKISSRLQEISRCLFGILGLKKTDIVKQPEDEIKWRKFCFSVLRFLTDSSFRDYSNKIQHIRKGFNKCFNLNPLIEDVDLSKSLIDFFKESKKTNTSQVSYYSTIHSSKGLEATSVLVVAESENELLKWINFEKANTELDDDFRLGYVAFSRARDLLCVACLGTIKPSTKETLKGLNFSFSSEVLA